MIVEFISCRTVYDLSQNNMVLMKYFAKLKEFECANVFR